MCSRLWTTIKVLLRLWDKKAKKLKSREKKANQKRVNECKAETNKNKGKAEKKQEGAQNSNKGPTVQHGFPELSSSNGFDTAKFS